MIINDEYPSKVCNDCTKDIMSANLLRDMLLECNEKALIKIGNAFFDKMPEVFEDEIKINLDVIKTEENKYESYVDAWQEAIQIPESETPQNKEHHKILHKKRKTPRVKKPCPPRIKPVLRDSQRFKPVLKREFRKHPVQVQTTYFCHHCQTAEEDLESHMKIVHLDQPIEFKCPQCSKTFDRFKNLKSHIHIIHEMVKLHVCDECGAKFRFAHILKSHMKVVHEKVTSFICAICSSGFRTKGSLKIHMRSHTGERPYKCQYCPKVSKSDVTFYTCLVVT